MGNIHFNFAAIVHASIVFPTLILHYILSMPVDGIDADEETSRNFFTSLSITANE